MTASTATPDAASSAAGADTFDRRLIGPMILGSILNPINSSIIAVSLIPIGRAFGEPPSRTAWLVSALYLATSIGQPVFGKLIDVFGPRRLYLLGASLTGTAGVVGTLAPDLDVLVVARVILGFGTCAGYPAAMYLIRSEARRTGHDSPAGILTALAISSQTIAVIGPTLGGGLIGLAGWRATFAVNIPLALACLALGLLRLPRHARAVDTHTDEGPVFDLPGIALFAATLVTLLLFLMELRPALWWLPVLTVVAGTVFAWRELHTAAPFVDLRVLGGNVPLLLTYARSLLSAVVSYAFLYGFTQWLEDGRGLSPSGSGLILLPVFGLGLLVSATTGRSPRVHAKLVVGSAMQVVACGLLLLLGSTSPIWLLLAVAAVLGVPQGLNSLANQNALYFQADPERIGASAGLLRTFFYLGAILASAATGILFGQTAGTAGLHHLGWLILGVSATYLLITLVDRSLTRVGAPAPVDTTTS